MLTALPNPGRATTLVYTSDSIVEFDLFHQWTRSGGLLWTLSSDPAPAAWAALHVEFSGALADLSFYSLKRSGGLPAGHTLISDFTLSVVTDRGHYEINEYLYRDIEMIVEIGVAGRLSDWTISWDFGSSDFFRMEGGGGNDQVSWLFEYLEYPGQYDDLGYAWDVAGGGSFTGGGLSVAQSLGQTPLSSMPLPAPVLFLLSGLAGLWGVRRIRPVRA